MTSSNAKLMDGTALAARLLDDARAKVSNIHETTGVIPTLATVLVGDNPASATYVRMKRKRCEDVGMKSLAVELPLGTSTEELVAEIEQLGEDGSVHGILVQHPVPAPIDKRAAFEAIPPETDVDGVTSSTIGRVMLGMPVAELPGAGLPCIGFGGGDLFGQIHALEPRECGRGSDGGIGVEAVHEVAVAGAKRGGERSVVPTWPRQRRSAAG